ncbi:hypothetical protein SAMN02910413_1699 [Pseudobutyrivibrio sp. C4]|uniref:hypothetical protein n=1 Tax=Pseudobutyrivibrio sp. C4 TaxID=1520803 RepID=UPI0008CBF19A|nr:hypothetical protein [Pseudobutyrivibrio sp. C4]SET06257.1 hypothetical protein SAMN02910413_1699 [Pseudobutyrivibrio sp. C4]
MAINYEKIGWEDKPTETTPLNKTNLDRMDSGIKAACDGIDEACNVTINSMPASQLNFALNGTILNITIS